MGHPRWCFEGAEEVVEGEGEEEREEGVGDEDAGEEEDACGREGEEGRVEGGEVAEGAARPGVAEEGEGEDGERQREMRGEGGFAEGRHAEGGNPVGEWGFFEVADAVDAEGDEVVRVEHGLRGLSVGGVGVVEQRRGVEAGGEDG